MKRSICLIAFLICVFLLPVSVRADLSSNLQVNKEINPATRKTTRETYVDSQGNPVAASDKGYVSVIYTYNGANLLTETRFLDAAGETVNCTEGYASVQYTYQQRNVIKTVYLDASGQPVIGPEGYAVKEIKRGARGVAKETLEYDAEGQLFRRGVTEYVDEQKSNLIKSETWYNGQNELSEGPEGYAKAIYEYNKRKKSHAAYYKPDGSLFFYKKDGYAEMKEVYEKGVLKELHYYGEDGQLIAGPKGFARATYSYAKGGDETLTMYYNADGSLFFTSKGYCGIKQLYKNKKVVDESYYKDEGVRGYSNDGYSRTTLQYTLWRTVGYQCYYDDQDNLMCPENIGYAKIKNIYNSRYLVRTEYYSADNKLMLGPDGYAVVEHVFKNKLNTEDVLYDTDGKTVINGNGGYAKIVYQYNENKQCVGQTFYDADGNPVLISGEADEIRAIWANNQVIGQSYWKDGEPVAGEKGYHEIRHEYTTSGKIKNEFYYNENGNLTQSIDGYAGIEIIYNSKGREMATLYYDEQGELMLTPGKEYAYMLTIPEQDKMALTEGQQEEMPEEEPTKEEITEEETDEEESDEAEEIIAASTTFIEYYGTDRKLMNLSSGYAYVARQTDEQGRIIREQYFDKDGNKAALKNGYDEYRQYFAEGKKPYRYEYYLNEKPVLFDNNYAAIEREYDETGNTVTERYFGIDLNPASCKAGYEMIRREYNEENRVSQDAYFDHRGTPMTNKKGVYITAYEYNENGKAIRETYFDAEGNPINCQDGYAGLGKMYNSKGNAIATLYYDTAGELMLTPGKEYAYMITTPAEERGETGKDTDESIKTVYIEYYGPDQRLMNLSYGYACIIRQTDEQGRTIGEKYLDAAGQPVVQAKGYDEIRQEYKDGNKPYRIEYYKNEEPVLFDNNYAAIEREYDEAGNITEERYFGTDLKPAACKAGYEMIRKEYNQENRVRKEEFLDHTGTPMTNPKGVYQTAYEYNETGKVTKETYYDAEGMPMNCQDGYAGLERMYNSQGSNVATLYYDTAGELVLAPGKEYAYTITTPAEERDGKDTDENIKTVYIEYYGTDRQLKNLSSGYAYIIRQTDEKGRTIREEYFDADRQPVVQAKGYDELRQHYIDGNKPNRIEYYLNGEPVLYDDNYAAIEREYDNMGNTIVERYYDTSFQLAKCKNGYAMTKREYDEKKQVIREQCFDTSGEPMVNSKGVYQITYEYNEQGKVTKEAYYDANDKPMANKNGYIMIERTYNKEGKKISETSYTGETDD